MTQVSYIVTVDNQRPYLDAMLKSLREQTGDFSCEFVFVDDGSEDGSFDVLIEKTRLWPRTLLIQQRRQGPSVAALTGAKAATGDHWVFLDGDLVLAVDATRFLLSVMMANDLDMVLAAHALCDEPETHDFDVWDSVPDLPALDNATYTLLSAPVPSMCHMMVRRGVFRDPGFFDVGAFLPDFAAPLQASVDRRIGLLDVPISAGCPDAPSQLRRGGGQAAFDCSVAIAGFLAAHPDLPARCRRAALRTVTQLAWAAARTQ
ncbi:MAG: glycosyltransferase family 2 protein, partial [Rhodospirillaceae bacterium]|nr:glycosyltransferase family 2 protein [Rhodospirillaceae bacterium]